VKYKSTTYPNQLAKKIFQSREMLKTLPLVKLILLLCEFHINHIIYVRFIIKIRAEFHNNIMNVRDCTKILKREG